MSVLRQDDPLPERSVLHLITIFGNLHMSLNTCTRFNRSLHVDVVFFVFYTSVRRGVLGTRLQTNIPGTAVMSSGTSNEIDTNIKGQVDTERQKVQQILVPYNTVMQNNNAESRATTSASNADRPLDQNMYDIAIGLAILL